jgi:hypothetical protein
MGLGNQAGGVKNGTNGSAETAAIDQVRDLLFGGAQRSIETRLDDLDHAVEAKIKALKQEFAEHITELQDRLAAAERDAEQRRINSVQDIGTAIAQLGATINKLATPPER